MVQQGDDFGIHLRLKKLNGFSAIAAVAVNIGDDFLQVNDYGSMSAYVDDLGIQEQDYYPQFTGYFFALGGQGLSYDIDDYGTSTYKIELPTEDGEDHYIAIDTFNAGSVADNADVTDEKGTASMSVRIHGHGNVFSGSKGLCGDWDQTTPGFYDRNGVVMTIPNPTGYTSFYDATAFGNEWRVDDSNDPGVLIPNQFSNNLNPSEWGKNVCVEQGARRRILQDAKRKLDPCSKCDDLESSGAPQVQVDWCNYDAVALSCDFVSNAPMYDQSNPMFASLYKADCAGCGGDPHLKTFSGHAYSYHGQCDMVLLQSREFSSGAGLDIHIRTTRVDKAKGVGYSYISGVAVKLGTDVLEVMDDGKLIVNGKPVSNPINFAGYPISKTFKGTHQKIIIYDLDVTTDKAVSKPIQIRVNTNAGMLFVDISGRFPDSAGLLGPPSDDKRMLARDGETDLFDEWNSFGEEWQVRNDEPKLFQEKRAPQYPQGCVYESNESKSLRRRLSMDSGVTTAEAEAACSGSKGRSKEFCIADVMATGMVDIAEDEFYL